MTQVTGTLGVRSAATKFDAATAPGSVEILSYDHKSGSERPGRRTGQGPSTDKVVNEAFDAFTAVQDYFAKTYHRSGWDGRGAKARVVVHAPDEFGNAKMNNAYWDSSDKSFHMGDGDGSIFTPLGSSKDIAAHEYTHAVVDSSVDLDYSGQEGGINESWADVLASGIDGNWMIGEDSFTPNRPGDGLRDMTRPTYGNFKTLPKGVNEVHDLSGIPSLAAVKVATTVGRDAMQKIWYKGLTDHLEAHAGFSGAARATVEAAAALYGKQSKEYAAVRDAWRAVGVDAKWEPTRQFKISDALKAQAHLK